MRHTFLYPLHMVIPVLGSGVFLLYYHGSGWSGAEQIAGYLEVIGIVLPFAASIVCAGNVGLEEKIHFQTLLGGSACKGNSFLAKFLVLLGLGMLAVIAAVFLFGTGYRYVPGKEGISIQAYGGAAAVLCLGSIPLYLEHLSLNLMFPRTASLCVGVAQFLLSALFLTGLGDGKWFFFPCTWSARGAGLFLALLAGKEGNGILMAEAKMAAALSLLLLLLISAVVGIGFHFFEGRAGND